MHQLLCERPNGKAFAQCHLCIFGDFSGFCLPVWEGHRSARASPGARVPLTSCLWALSCWWMPFAEPELLMACKSHGQMLSEVHRAAVPSSSTRWQGLLDRIISGSKLTEEWRSQDPHRWRLSGQGCISPLSLRSSW